MSDEAFKGVNTIFSKPIHKIIFEIQNNPFFKWLKQMGSDPSTRDTKLHCSYHKDHGHKMKNCKTLKQFLERIVEQGHLSEYIKTGGRKTNQGKNANDRTKASNKEVVAGVIKAIHGITDKSAATKNYLRARLARAQFMVEAYPIAEVMSVLATKKDRDCQISYELNFSEDDLEGKEIPHNDVLVLTVHVCNYDVKRILIDLGSLSEVMYLSLYNQLKCFIPSKNV